MATPSLPTIQRPPARLILGIVALAFATRIRALLSPQGDANVGTYFYIAHLWLRGTLPYIVAWEYKPPGLFALCSAGLLVFRDASLASSMLGAFAAIAAALATYVVVASGADDEAHRAATLSAVFVVLLSIENSGIRSDAEVFVNACVAVAFAFAVAKPRWPGVIGCSFAASAALQMKLTAGPILAAIAATLLVRYGFSAIAYCAAYCAIVALPFGVEALIYERYGALAAFFDANVSATLRRASGVRYDAGNNGRQWVRELTLFAPVVELGVLAFVRPSRTVLVPALWLAGAAAAIAAAGEAYDRHFVLLVPPVSILGAFGAMRIARFASVRFRTAVMATIVLATFLLHGYYEVAQGIGVGFHRYALRQSDFQSGDYTVILAMLQDEMKGDRSLFAIHISPEIYEDLHVPPPTPYVFTGNLLERPMWPMIGMPGRSEFARALASRPHFIACGPLEKKYDPPSVLLLQETLAHDYTFLREARNVRVYELRTLTGA